MRMKTSLLLLGAVLVSGCANGPVEYDVSAVGDNRFTMTSSRLNTDRQARATERQMAEQAHLYCADQGRPAANRLNFSRRTTNAMGSGNMNGLASGGMCGASVCPGGSSRSLIRVHAEFSCEDAV